jgi:hypothetical protein
VFSFIYSTISSEFHINNEDKKTFIDFFLLSTTIQAGVGISDLYPLATHSKIVVILQQMVMLFTHVITMYVFTL